MELLIYFAAIAGFFYLADRNDAVRVIAERIAENLQGWKD